MNNMVKAANTLVQEKKVAGQASRQVLNIQKAFLFLFPFLQTTNNLEPEGQELSGSVSGNACDRQDKGQRLHLQPKSCIQ